MPSDAFDILSSRLAKGEITEEEFDRLTAKLASAPKATDKAPPEVAASMPAEAPRSATTGGGSKIPSWIGGIVGVYLGLCVLLALVASPATAAAAVNEGCSESGGSILFCQCYATEATKGYGFLTAPLWYLGVGRVSPTQANYICNSR
jgi:hypothetical protein